MLSRQSRHSPLPSCHCAARAFSFTSFTSLTSSKSFTIRTSKTPLPQLLYNPHLPAPLGSAGNKGLITPLESALTKNSPVSRLESALTKRWGVGVRFAVHSPRALPLTLAPAPTYNPAVSSVASQSNFISGSNRMKKSFWMCAAGILVLFGQAARLAAQAPEREAKAPEAKPAEKCDPATAKEESSVTEHTIKIGGQTIPYKATASTTLLKNEKGDSTGLMYSAAYTRSDVKDLSTRPVSFLYNGGPGSATMWLHMGAFGPRRAYTVDGTFTPPAPYKLVDNPESLLDKTDLVFIDAMGTGYSHAVCKAENKDFYGIDEDVEAFAQFIVTYLSR